MLKRWSFFHHLYHSLFSLSYVVSLLLFSSSREGASYTYYSAYIAPRFIGNFEYTFHFDEPKKYLLTRGCRAVNYWFHNIGVLIEIGLFWMRSMDNPNWHYGHALFGYSGHFVFASHTSHTAIELQYIICVHCNMAAFIVSWCLYTIRALIME